VSGSNVADGDKDMEAPVFDDDELEMGAVSPALDAVVASMVGGDVERVTSAIVAARDGMWFSAVWAWARVVVELAWTGSAGGGAVPLGVWVGRYLPVTCEAEMVEDVSVVIATALDGLPSSLRQRWAALGEAGQIRCGEAVLALAVAASTEAVARNRSGPGRGAREDKVRRGSP